MKASAVAAAARAVPTVRITASAAAVASSCRRDVAAGLLEAVGFRILEDVVIGTVLDGRGAITNLRGATLRVGRADRGVGIERVAPKIIDKLKRLLTLGQGAASQPRKALVGSDATLIER